MAARLTKVEKIRRFREERAKTLANRRNKEHPLQDVYMSPSGLSYVRNHKGIALPFVRGYYGG
jgi:hypothetical protein